MVNGDGNKIRGYQDLEVWNLGMQLAVSIYSMTQKFPDTERYGLSSQMRRSAVSIPSNIAEGSKRGSRKDFRQFLLIAYGSGAELETQIEIARRLDYLNKNEFKKLEMDLSSIMRMLNRFVFKLQTINHKPMKIFFASDHAGFELKSKLIPFVESLGYEAVDKGGYEADSNDDYPDFVRLAGIEVSEEPTRNRAIVIGGSGQGEAIVANRFPNVRAVVYYGGTLDIVKLSREHNDANVLSLGARFMSEEEAKNAVELWLKTPFSEDERHARRIKKIEGVLPNLV